MLMNTKLGKNIVLLLFVPFMFACTKSKFSAVKNNPTTPLQQTNNPLPIQPGPGPVTPPPPPPVIGNPGNNGGNTCNGQPCTVPPNTCPSYQPGCPGYVPPAPCPSIQVGCPGYIPPIIIPPAPQCPSSQRGCPGYVEPYCPSTQVGCPGYIAPQPQCPSYQVGCPGYIAPQSQCPSTQQGCPGYVAPQPHCPSTQQGCPGYQPPYCPNTQQGCPGYVAPEPVCPGGPSCPQEKPEVPNYCVEQEHEVPQYSGPRGMNVWVVMDGSKSNTKERYSQLEALVKMYEQHLVRRMPVTISVITGHSPESRDSAINGSLFYKHSNEPSVIRLDASMSAAKRAQAMKALQAKIIGMRTDNSKGVSDGGELLTVNLLAALKPENRAKAQSMGAYGKGNILNIHFVGDENDICTVGQVADPDKITVNGKKVSREEYARYKHCTMMDVGSEGYSKTLLNEINAIKASGEVQMYLTGFIYTGENPVPHEGENEIGRGMLELIQATGGRAYDLAALRDEKSYSAGSTALISHINTEGDYYLRYQVSRDGQTLDLSDIDRKSTKVYADGEQVRYRTADGHIYPFGVQDNCKKIKIVYCRKH